MKIHRTIYFFFAVFFSVFFPTWAQAEDIFFETRLERSHSWIFLPITIDGKTYSFLFDTGATYTVLDASLKNLLGKPLTKRELEELLGIRVGQLDADTPTGKIRLPYYRPIDVMLGNMNLKTQHPFMAVDLTFLGKVGGRKFHGIIGMAFIRKYIWDLDFDENRLRVHALGTEISRVQFEVVKDIRWFRMTPIIYASIGEMTIPFLVDTGDTGSGTLAGQNLDTLMASGHVADVSSIPMPTFTGVTYQRRARVTRLKLDSLEYQGLLMHESSMNSLGLDFLKRHHVLLDFPNQTFYLKKGSRFQRVDREGKSGIKIIKDGQKVVVFLVDQRGPAATVGIKRGDIIHSINNLPAQDHDLSRIRDLLRGEDGEEILLTITRDGQKLEKRFFLKKGYDRL
jgi:predicted aspartyl protease